MNSLILENSMFNLLHFIDSGCSVYVDVFEFLAEAHISCSDGDMRMYLGKITMDDIEYLERNGIDVYVGD